MTDVDNTSFQNRVVVVTGGAGGIGRCLVETFAQAGAQVAYIDTDTASGMALQALITARGRHAFFYPGDISNPYTLAQFVEVLQQRYAGVDVLVNNACLSRRGILSGCGAADFQYVQQVGVTAPYLLASLLLPVFRQGASIVNIASTRAFQSQADTESYSAAKGGILALTHALAVSLSQRVRVNAVSPGWIDTTRWHGLPEQLGGNPQTPPSEGNPPTTRLTDADSYEATAPETPAPADLAQHPANRIGTPPDIARAVLFLAHPDNSFITGQNLTVDGGMSVQMIYHGDEGWTYVPSMST